MQEIFSAFATWQSNRHYRPSLLVYQLFSDYFTWKSVRLRQTWLFLRNGHRWRDSAEEKVQLTLVGFMSYWCKMHLPRILATLCRRLVSLPLYSVLMQVVMWQNQQFLCIDSCICYSLGFNVIEMVIKQMRINDTGTGRDISGVLSATGLRLLFCQPCEPDSQFSYIS